MIEIILAQAPSITTGTPTWENLIPWVVGFFASAVSFMVYFILNKLWKQGDEVRAEMTRLNDNAYFSNRARLMGLARDVALHPSLQVECVEMVKELDQKNPKLAERVASATA